MTQTKTCLHCSGSFEITQADLDFYNKISPTFAGEKFPIPTPTLCPDCRQRRRLSFRNERRLYKRKCDASGKDIISIYVPGLDYVVYDQKIRWSDDRDPMKYGMDFDFTKNFTEQFGELMRVVPRMNILQRNCHNSEYCNDAEGTVNSYLSFISWESENILYSRCMFWAKDCLDCLWISRCNNCYESINCFNSYGLRYSNDSYDCFDSIYISYCKGVSSSIFCVGIANKKRCILNKEYLSWEYELLLQNIKQDKNLYLKYKNEYIDLKQNYVYNTINNSENVNGRYVNNSKDCHQVFDCDGLNLCSYIYQGGNLYDCYDLTITGSSNASSLSYEGCCCADSSKCLFSNYSRSCNNSYYCDSCYNSSHLFGCIGLRNKQYCIFNKQYSKEDYEVMVGKIIRHMMSTDNGLPCPERGEFFHPSLSPFGYNETVAQEYYPLEYDTNRRDALMARPQGTELSRDGHGKPTSLQVDYLQFGYHRSTYVAPTPQVDKVIKGQDVPDTIDDVSDDILKMAVLCEVSNKPFRITPQELVFYRKHHIPLPRKHPDVRHEERMKLRR